jgi:hypothetical protein
MAGRMTTRRPIGQRERLAILPLTAEEAGRGVHLPKEREAELVAECLRLIRAGVKQWDIAAMLGASRSRVSRWCQAAVGPAGAIQDRRLVKGTGQSLAQMVWARLDVQGKDDCWNWIGFVKPNGYGSLNYKGKTYQAHRAVFEALVGPVPDGMVVDHQCENKTCCNPRHLQCVLQSENLYLVKARA